jgi:hypothetical protein
MQPIHTIMEVTTLPPSFAYWNLEFVYDTLLL